MHDELHGILPVLPTPFLPDGSTDQAAMRSIVRFAISAGVNGLVYPGFASEVSELDPHEHGRLLASVVSEANSQVSVIGGASASTIDGVIFNGQVAQALDIRHLLIQPPLEIGNRVNAVVDFMAEIARSLPEAILILQNAPAPRGSDLSPEALVATARAVPQIAYIKEETLPAGPAISYLLANRPASLKGVAGGGGARYILDEYERGACAAMPAVEIADLHVALDKAWRAGRSHDARRLYVQTLPLLTLQAVYRMRLTKHVLMRRGLLSHVGVRAETPELDAQAIADIDTNLVELGLVERDMHERAGAA